MLVLVLLWNIVTVPPNLPTVGYGYLMCSEDWGRRNKAMGLKKGSTMSKTFHFYMNPPACKRTTVKSRRKIRLDNHFTCVESAARSCRLPGQSPGATTTQTA